MLLDVGLSGSTSAAAMPGSFNIKEWSTSNMSYISAWDSTGSGDIGLMLRTQDSGAIRSAARFSAGGNMTVFGAISNCTIGNGTGATNCTSDERLKERVSVITSALEKVSALRGVTFHWKAPHKAGPEHLGLIAQEVEKVFPQAVSDIDDMDLGKAKAVDYAVLVAPMIEAIKELKAANDQLRAEFEAYKASHP
jgi:hypothetical protein